MEKNNIFDTDLNSLMNNQMIDVDAVGDTSFMPQAPPVKPKEEKKDIKQEPEDDGMIDLDVVDETKEEEEEVTDEDIKEEPSSDNKPPQKKESDSSSPLTPYAKLLKDEGILPNINLEEFDGTSDGLKEAMLDEIMGAVDMYKQSLPPRIKNLINNYEEGVPLEKLLELDKNEVEVSTIDDDTFEESVDLQKKILSDYLKKTTKFSETKISKLIQGFEDGGELEEEAKNALSELRSSVEEEKKSTLKQVEEQKKLDEENRKKTITTLQDTIKTTKEIIPGIKVNDKVKESLFQSMTTPVGYDKNGMPVNKIVAARMEDPINFEIKLHYLFEITKGFTDFSKLAEKGKKETMNSFEEAVKQLDKKGNGGLSNEQSPARTKIGSKFLNGLTKTYNI